MISNTATGYSADNYKFMNFLDVLLKIARHLIIAAD